MLISQNISPVEREVIVSLIVNKLKSTTLIRPKSRLKALVLFFFLPSYSLNPDLMHAKQVIYQLYPILKEPFGENQKKKQSKGKMYYLNTKLEGRERFWPDRQGRLGFL